MLFCLPVQAFQVKVLPPNVQLKAGADARSAAAGRIGTGRALLLDSEYAPDGELWCRVDAGGGRSGWLPARFLDPMLKDNLPLRLSDLPGAFLFDFAHREVIYKSSLNAPTLKGHLVRWTLVMEMALLKERWDSSRQRLNFLEISRRIGVKISAQEYSSLQKELKIMESKFQQLLLTWQRS